MTDVLLLAAMAEESAPIIGARAASAIDVPGGNAYTVTHDRLDVVLVTTGIGLVNAAMATAVALERFAPRRVISVGSAGGLGPQVRRGDIVIGSSYRYADADATAFGYAYGQIPSMPLSFPGDEGLLSALASHDFGSPVHVGEIVSGNSFVAGDLTSVVRERFPDAVAADMESTAIAQVAWRRGVPFVCVRAISDLCGPSAGDDFRDAIDTVAQRSSDAVWQLIDRL